MSSSSCSFVQALRSCTSLRWLNLAHNSLADLDGLQDLTTLNVSTSVILLLGEAFQHCGGGFRCHRRSCRSGSCWVWLSLLWCAPQVLNASHNSLSSIQAVTGLQALNALILSGEPTHPYSWHARQMVCLLCLVQKTIRIMSLTTEPGRSNTSSMIDQVGTCPSQNSWGLNASDCRRGPKKRHGAWPLRQYRLIHQALLLPPGCDPGTLLQPQSGGWALPQYETGASAPLLMVWPPDLICTCLCVQIMRSPVCPR